MWHITIYFILQLSQSPPYVLGQAKLVKPWVTSLRSPDCLLCVLVQLGRMTLSFCKSHFLCGAQSDRERQKPLAPRESAVSQELWKSPIASDLTRGTGRQPGRTPAHPSVSPLSTRPSERHGSHLSREGQMSLCPPLPSGDLLLTTSQPSTATSDPSPDLEAEV